jgi:hypothetical protein
MLGVFLRRAERCDAAAEGKKMPPISTENQGLKLGYLDSNQEQKIQGLTRPSRTLAPKFRELWRMFVMPLYVLLRGDTD